MALGSFAADVGGAMTATAPLFVAFVLLVAFMIGLLPIPIGYERGKVRWLMWCATGQHLMVCYWTGDHGFQTLHPDDRSHGGDA